MPSSIVSDWKFGLDRRRQRYAGVPGTLWDAKNVVISRGGDIERAKSFVSTYSLPVGKTFGQAELQGQLYVFGSDTRPVDLSSDINYQQLISPTGSAMVAILDAKPVFGQIYAIAQFTDGTIYHYYNGSRVTSWDTILTGGGLNARVAALASAANVNTDVKASATANMLTLTGRVVNTAFSVSAVIINNGPIKDGAVNIVTTPGHPAQAGVATTFQIVIDSGTAFGIISQVAVGIYLSGVLQSTVNLLDTGILYVSDNSTTATALANAIRSSTQGVANGVATSTSGSTVFVSSSSTTLANAAHTIGVTLTTSNVTAHVQNIVSGKQPVAAAAQISNVTYTGTFQAIDLYSVTINGITYSSTGNSSAAGTVIYVSDSRAYSISTIGFSNAAVGASSSLYYSALNNPTDWTNTSPSSGAGQINVASQSEGSEPLSGIGIFDTQTAVFSRRSITIYSLSADATQISSVQNIDNSGAIAPRAIIAYGNIDTFYLDETGIRSLKPRVATNTAYVDDVGTAIAPFVRLFMDTLPDSVLQQAVAAIEPRDGRLFFAIGNRIFVYNSFPNAQISAWTYIDPGFNIDWLTRVRNRLYVRSGDTIYLYGGADGVTYPADNELVATVKLPHIGQSPPVVAEIMGVDLACSGQWQINLLPNPNDDSIVQDVGTFFEVTYIDPNIGTGVHASLCGIDFVCSKGGPATISNMTLHWSGGQPQA